MGSNKITEKFQQERSYSNDLRKSCKLCKLIEYGI